MYYFLTYLESDQFIKYIKDQPEDLTIVYCPHCEPLLQRHLTREDVLGILSCLKELQRLGVIHRDLSNQHFMRGPDKKIILIDFGSAIFTDSKVELNKSTNAADKVFHTFQGSIEFAADDILEHLADPYK